MSRVAALQLSRLSSAMQERPELPCARHRQLQSSPKDPLQGTAELSTQDGGTSGKVYLEKGKMLLVKEG